MLKIRVAVVLAVARAAASAGGAEQGPADLTRLSLEELANIEVTSVAKKKQRLSETAAAIHVITQEDLRRSGATSIPEALRMVPGVQVARIDSNKWAISARGFNGRFATKLLVLIDGRSVYTPLFSGVFWDAQDTLLEDIERIEVIRGPGATMWGANAVNGVINIITKHARDTQGSLATAGGGNEENGFGAVRFGDKIGSNTYYRVYSKYFKRDDLTEEAGGGRSADHWYSLRGGFRADWERSERTSITVQGDIFGGRAGQIVSVPSLRPPFTRDAYDRAESSGGHVLGRWRHRSSDTSEYELQFYYDRFERNETVLRETRDTFDVAFQHRLAPARRHEVVWGFGSRASSGRSSATPIGRLEPEDRADRLWSAFLQDEIELVPDRLRLVVGSEFQHNDYSGFEVQPTARLLWTPSRRHSGWAAVSRAVRTPSRGEHDSQVNYAAFEGPFGLPLLVSVYGDRSFRSETQLSYELGYRAQPSERLSVDLATFYSVYDRLRTLETGAVFLDRAPAPHLVFPQRLGNGLRGETYGAEAAANWSPTRAWRLSGAYSWLRLQLHRNPSSTALGNEDGERHDPRHQFHLRSYLDLPAGLQFDTALYYVGSLPALRIRSYTRLDSRLGWRPAQNLELSLGLQNLLDNRHAEFVAEALTRRTEVGRSAYGRITWRF